MAKFGRAKQPKNVAKKKKANKICLIFPNDRREKKVYHGGGSG
jgi:hypothetical protein